MAENVQKTQSSNVDDLLDDEVNTAIKFIQLTPEVRKQVLSLVDKLSNKTI